MAETGQTTQVVIRYSMNMVKSEQSLNLMAIITLVEYGYLYINKI